MTLDGRIFYLTSVAIIRWLLEVFLKEIKARRKKRTKRASDETQNKHSPLNFKGPLLQLFNKSAVA
jgi:hypothetical protein